MGANDDLFAAYTRVDPATEAPTPTPKSQENNADLFAAFTRVPPEERDIAPQPVAPQAQPAPEQTDQPLTFNTANKGSRKSRRDAERPTSNTGVLSKFSDMITGADRETEATRTLPEFADTDAGSFKNNVTTAATQLVTLNPKAQVDILRKHVPGIKFENDEKGNIIVDLNGRKSVLNKPGFSGIDARQLAFGVLSFLPASLVSNLVTKTSGKIAAAGAASAATDAALQGAAIKAGSEQGFDIGQTALAGAAGAAAEGVAPLLSKIRKPTGIDPVDLPAARREIETVQQAQRGIQSSTGVDVGIFPSQATLIPADIQKQSFIPQLSGSGNVASRAIKAQNKELWDAMTGVINRSAPGSDDALGGFKTAAEAALAKRKQVRSERASPLYDRAFSDTTTRVNTTPVISKIDSALEFAPKTGQVRREVSKLKRNLEDANTPLKTLHNLKLEIDDKISKFGEGALNNTTKRELVTIQEELVKQMDNASPAYKQAKASFAELSPPVDQVKDSIIGKISALSDDKIDDVSKRLFDPKVTSKSIQDAKAVIDDIDPNAWPNMVQSEMRRRIAGIESKADAQGIAWNLPGEIKKTLFGRNPEARRVLMAGLDTETKKNMVYLETLVERASIGRAQGSQTAARQDILRDIGVGAAGAVRDFILQPIKSVAGIGESQIIQNRVGKLAEIYFNPKNYRLLEQIRSFSPNKPLPAPLKASFQALLVDDDDGADEP